MGSKAGDAPKLSDPEKELIKLQKQLLGEAGDVVREQLNVSNLLAPFLYEQIGLTPKYDEAGKIIGFDKATDPLSSKYKEIEGLYADRQLAALKGELPVNPALLRDLKEQEGLLKEGLFKQLGPGWETGSAGIEQMGDFMERKEILLDQSRRGDMTQAAQLGMGYGNFSSDNVSDFLGRAGGVAGQPASFASLFTGISGGYQSPLAMYSAARQSRQQLQGAMWGGIGELAGTFAGLKMCWVARLVFGEDNPRWIEFREWMLTQAPAPLVLLYFRLGEQFAAFLEDKPALQRYIRRLMNRVLER